MRSTRLSGQSPAGPHRVSQRLIDSPDLKALFRSDSSGAGDGLTWDLLNIGDVLYRYNISSSVSRESVL